MALTPGTRIGPYEITGALGAGGMGEVYRARDGRLGRDVALKVLPDAFAADAERLARFQREAQVLAALSHPNIAGIYGLEEVPSAVPGQAPIGALVLELIEGPTLADRIAAAGSTGQGPEGRGTGPLAGPAGLPIDEALAIARQIAEALEAAHEQGVIHRDLKPANIKLRPDGTVKVLDFGLAKLVDTGVLRDASSAAGLSQSPTLTSPARMTGVGAILGTAAYMAPEQAKGQPADKRSDVWAFGCVLYEMLTGRRAFEGDDVSDTLAAVLRAEADWTALPPSVPPATRTLLRRCLEKDRRKRIADIAAASFAIDEQASLVLPSSEEPATINARTQAAVSAMREELAASSRRRVAVVAVAAVLVGALAYAGLLSMMAPTGPPAAPVRVYAELGADVSLVTALGAAAVLSPDGSMMAFTGLPMGAPAGQQQLHVRRLDQLQATALPGTNGAINPFFSPDGQWIAFFAAGQLKKVAITGGAVVTLCDAQGGRGGTWTDDDVIVFQPRPIASEPLPLMRVPAAGGQPEPIPVSDTALVMRWPQVLPGGRAVLYTATAPNAAGNNPTAYNLADLVVQAIDGGAPTVVYRGGYYGRYLQSGHLVYVRDGTLFAAPFDLDAMALAGAAVPAVQDLTSSAGVGGAQFSVSNTGTLVYRQGDSVDAARRSPVHWMERSGKTMPLRATPATWAAPRFSPDGRRLALMIADGAQPDVWVYDWERDTLTRLTVDPAVDGKPLWTPDGSRITFGSTRSGPFNLYWQRADGSGEVQRLTESSVAQIADSWHPNGKLLAFHEGPPPGKSDILILPIEGGETSGWKPGKPTVFLSDSFRKIEATFSPDGRWLAYVSNESGRNEVYVRPFPGPGGKWQISSDGGTEPRWSPGRSELLFRTLQGTQLMVVPYTARGETFEAARPRLWSEGRFDGTFTVSAITGTYDVHPDGNRVAIMPVPETPDATRPDRLVFVFNFFNELRRIAPVAR